MDLTDEQWALLEPLIPEEERRTSRRRGRPWRDPHDVLNGVLWILRTGAPWSDLPERYPPYQTCHRRFQRWVRAGLMEVILRTLASTLTRSEALRFSSRCRPKFGVFPMIADASAVIALSLFVRAPRMEFANEIALDSLHAMCSPSLGRMPMW